MLRTALRRSGGNNLNFVVGKLEQSAWATPRWYCTRRNTDPRQRAGRCDHPPKTPPRFRGGVASRSRQNKLHTA